MILRDEPDRLRTSLSFLQDSGDVLAEVAERSYSHPNGFAKIVLTVTVITGSGSMCGTEKPGAG